MEAAFRLCGQAALICFTETSIDSQFILNEPHVENDHPVPRVEIQASNIVEWDRAKFVRFLHLHVDYM